MTRIDNRFRTDVERAIQDIAKAYGLIFNAYSDERDKRADKILSRLKNVYEDLIKLSDRTVFEQIPCLVRNND